MKITKEEFETYEGWRKTGIFNMLDIRKGTGATQLPEKKYKYIIENYIKLSEKYPDKRGP